MDVVRVKPETGVRAFPSHRAESGSHTAERGIDVRNDMIPEVLVYDDLASDAIFFVYGYALRADSQEHGTSVADRGQWDLCLR